MPTDALLIDGQPLTLDDVESVARERREVALGASARAAVEAARRLVEERAGGTKPIYGVNTGFGSMSTYRIEPDAIRQVQRNLVRSHAAGVGELLPADTVRGMLVILAASLSRGRSGVRPVGIERIVDLLNQNVTPAIPSRGSVGASGDLAPLAHAALVLIGEGEVLTDGGGRAGSAALAAAGLAPLRLEAKEGLALINGTHLMSAMAALILCDVRRLRAAALAAAAMAIDACRATDVFLDERLHDARNQPGQRQVAEMLRQALAGSQIIPSHKQGDPRVQDPYCLRALPPVLGAAFDAVQFARGICEHELGGVSDNPLIFPESGSILAGANFHGMPLAIALDLLTIAICHIAGIAERRVDWLLKASDSENPVNESLSPQPGLHSGLMIAQYTAAACCNELRVLSTPASVSNIPTAAGVEDYNAMGVTSGHQARAATDLATHVIAIELLVMTEALEYQRPLHSGRGVERTFELVRSVVPRLTEDRPPAPDIAAIAQLIRQGAFEFDGS